MNYSVWSLFCLTFALFISVSLQVYIGDVPVCYGSSCPIGTTRCKKHIESSEQGFLHITINCLDGAGGSLKEYYFQEPSSLNPFTRYQSTSYSDIAPNPNQQLWGGNKVNALKEQPFLY